ncbi:AAA family ATPase [Pseudomonas alliivorans]|nr:AAA family ATPase [Pseudomonas alliivorans]MEE5055682.1 AAA family ATPase [Pseudomonas alliivorans]
MYIDFVVGKNGSGKSRHLQDIAHQANEKVIVICNTVHDRYKARPNVKKFSIRNPNSTPARIIKSAFVELAREATYKISAIAKVLEYCHYEPELMFRVVLHPEASDHLSELQHLANRGKRDFFLDEFTVQELAESAGSKEIEFSIDLTQHYIEPRTQEMLLSILEGEKYLRRLKLIKSIEILVRPKFNRSFVKLELASSGELTLIASQVFLLANIENCNTILIDEPENSLHPQWQKDYVNNLGNLIGRYDARVTIATHSPLIVSGVRNSEDRIGFHYAETGVATAPTDTPPSAEESLWEQFETITPESRYVSDHIVNLLEDLENKRQSFDSVTKSLNEMARASYDGRQEKVLQAAKNLALKIYQGTHHD